MNMEFIKANISEAIDLAINYAGCSNTKVRFIKPSNECAIATKAVIQLYDKGDFTVDLYGDLIPCREEMQKCGITITATKCRFNRIQLINFILDNELVLNISKEA